MRSLALAICVLAVTATAARADLLTPTTSQSVAGPAGLAVGDFNRDGDPDLVAADRFFSALAVLLGGTDAAFGPPGYYASHDGQTVAVGDFNGDGDPDAVVGAGLPANEVTLHLGGAGGTFESPVSITMGETAFGVTIADFDGDGNQDLATVDTSDGTISVRLGAGDGTFGARVAYPVGVPLGFDNASAADFDADGDLDLAVVTDSEVAVLPGAGNGTFGAATLYAIPFGPVSIAVGDLNRDGDPDLVVGRTFTADVLLMLGGPGVGFVPQAAGSRVAEAAHHVAVADFDEDGRLDVVAATRLSVSVLRGLGDGHFAPYTTYGFGPAWLELTVADFDRDGHMDVATSDQTARQVSILRNTAVPEIGVDASTLAFGTQPAATVSAVRTVRVLSTGDRALRVRSVRGGEEFLVARDTCSGEVISPGGSCAIGVRFAPFALGARAATLQVASDAGAVSVALGGTGVPVPPGPRGPAGPAGQDRARLVAVFASARQRAVARRRVRIAYVTTVAGPVEVVLQRGSRRLRTLHRRAAAGRNTIALKAPRRPGRYRLVLTARGGGQAATDRARLVVRRR